MGWHSTNRLVKWRVTLSAIFLKVIQTKRWENCDSSNIDKLIGNIASKGGTTEAGLNYLRDNNIGKLFENVIDMAQKRSVEIGVAKNF